MFDSARFSEQKFDVSKSFQSAKFYSDSKNSASFGKSPPARGLSSLRWQLWQDKLARRMDWGMVRGIGELAVLTRTSMYALIFVPILAGVWPALRSAVQRYAEVHWQEGVGQRALRWWVGSVDRVPRVDSSAAQSFLHSHMPGSFALLFFAALFVVLGRSIYQSGVPQLVREKSRFDLVRERMEGFRAINDAEQDRWLQEAIDFIEEAGTNDDLCAFRHPNLVDHQGRTYWIPSNLEDFKDLPEKIATTSTDLEAESAPLASPEQLKKTAEPAMSSQSRKNIAIQAGADAQYDLVARQEIGKARISLWCYTIAGLLVMWLFLEQAASVLQEVGFGKLAIVPLWAIVAACCVWLASNIRKLVYNAFWKRRAMPVPKGMKEKDWKNASEFTYDLQQRLRSDLPSIPARTPVKVGG